MSWSSPQAANRATVYLAIISALTLFVVAGGGYLAYRGLVHELERTTETRNRDIMHYFNVRFFSPEFKKAMKTVQASQPVDTLVARFLRQDPDYFEDLKFIPDFFEEVGLYHELGWIEKNFVNALYGSFVVSLWCRMGYQKAISKYRKRQPDAGIYFQNLVEAMEAYATTKNCGEDDNQSSSLPDQVEEG